MIYSCYLIAIRFPVLRCNAALRRLQARGNAERTGRMVDMKKRIAAVCAALMLAVPVQAQAMADSEDEINREVEAEQNA